MKRRQRARTCICLLVLISGPLLRGGQRASTDSLTGPTPVVDEALRVLSAGWSTVSAPARWNGTDVLRFGGIVAGTTGAALLDDEALSLMDRNRNALNDNIESIVVHYGATGTAILLSGGVYAAGLVACDPWLRETGLLMGTALAMTSLGVQILKPVIGRARPYTGLGNHYFTPLTLDNDFQAFPSGHAAAAFALSAVLAARIKNTWATIGLYSLATATALSRVYSRNHWFSDIVFSSLCSIAVSTSLVATFEGGSCAETSFRILPAPNGIQLVVLF